MLVYLDANVAIYFVEQTPGWGPKVSTRVATLRGNGDTFALSDLTRMECQVGPLKTGNVNLLADFTAFFHLPDARLLPMTGVVFDRAAALRVKYTFKTPDALHLAAAIEHGCDLFLTNDIRLSRCTEIAVDVIL